MSNQLRKSASFRSRIPVRRTKFMQRRYCSPPPSPSSLLPLPLPSSSSSGALLTSETHILLSSSSSSNINKRNNQTTTAAAVTVSKKSNVKYSKRNHRNPSIHHYRHNSLDSRKRYSSSSFSSSDESYESETSNVRLIHQIESNRNPEQSEQQQQQHTSKQHQQSTYQNDYNTSTDAISLDGLLDSVSSGGSFSSPQRSVTPEKYQDIKMEKLQHNFSYDSLHYYQNSVTKSPLEIRNDHQTSSTVQNERNSIRNISHIKQKDTEMISSPLSSRRYAEVNKQQQQQQLQLQQQKQQKQRQRHQPQNHNSPSNLTRNFSSNYYSDEDNAKIENYNFAMNQDNYGTNYSSSNIDLLKPLHSPLHNQRLNQRRRIIRRDNMNNCSPVQLQQQQQRQRQTNTSNVIRKQQRFHGSEKGINFKNPSRMSTTMSPVLPQKPAVPLRSPMTKSIHQSSIANQYHAHQYQKITENHIERNNSFKDSTLTCNNQNNNNDNGNGCGGGVGTSITRRIIPKRDDNLNFDKFKSKQMISTTSRKLENILAPCNNNNHPYTTSVATGIQSVIENNSNDDNNIITASTIQNDNCDDDGDGNDLIATDRYKKELKSCQVESNLNHKQKLQHYLWQQQQQQHHQQQQPQQKMSNMQKHSRIEENSDEKSLSEKWIENQNWQVSDKVITVKNFSYFDVKQNDNENNETPQIMPGKNQLKPSRSDNNWSLQKAKSSQYQKRLGETSSSSFEHINLGPTASRCGSIRSDTVTPSSPSIDRSNGKNENSDSINLTVQGQKLEYNQKDNSQKSPEPHSVIFPPGKTTSSYRSECELSGSYVSLECPSPPGPPACLPESRRDPQARLNNYLKTLYTDLALKEPIIPPWAIPVAPGALCPARLEPEIRLHSQSHGFNDCLTVDQLLTSIHTKEGTFLEAPRRVLIECPSWTSRCNLSLRILHAWAKEPPWPPKGTPVALALFIPLNEIKRSLANYVEKELLPKGPLNPFANGFGGFSSAWNSLESLGPKLLILLDGYDTHRGTPKRKGKHYPSDIHDLLDGKIFPHARVIITTSTTNNSELLPIIQRHVTYEGLTWGRSASLLGGGQWGAPTRLLDTVQECQHLRKIVRTPVGCLSIAAIFEATAGDLPTDELDVIESVLNCVAPETSQTSIAELGRLALFALKMKRPSITMSEIRMYCSTPDSSIMGCLDKELLLGKSARKKGDIFYHPMCPGMIEFLAANYLASLVNRPGLLAAEITGLSMGDELEPELLKVIKFAMGLLGTRAHILLSKLTPLWLTPQTIFSLALAGGSSDENLSALCDMLGISKHPPISPLETKPIWVQIRSVPNELMGWGMALKSPSCTLKNLEVIYQIEKHLLLDSRNAMEIFLDSLNCNESVSTLRISSLIENDVKDAEINYLANCVSKALLKPRLENFELALTLLEEDPPVLKLQSVVTALCRSIPRQPKLSSLVLDLGLNTSQLVQLCSTLEKSPNVTRLSLPHLRCERGAIAALASLLTIRPLSFLALPSCWGARDDPPSSSGVSMGSGSGSSTGTSGLVKQGSLTGVPSPRSYPPGIFSSLPRGVFVPTATMGRSATLPRQPMETMADKRSSDSVISKTWYPTPACDGGPHNSGTLHDLLLAAREPFSKLHGLDLSKAQLSLEDSMCLGETVRLSNTLHTLKLEGSSRLSEILPSVLGASESPSLQMLSIGSPRLNLEDPVIAMSARSLTSCSTLRLLSLDGWSFRVENPSTLSILRAFLSLTSIRELSLSNCRLQIGIFRSDTKIINAFESRSVVVLKLAGAQAILADSVILRGPQLLRFIGGFPCLRELDLSAPARSGFGTTVSSPLILDDKCLINFFQSLHTYFSLLNTLKMCNWVIHFDDPSKTLKYLSKCIRNSPLSHLKLDGISVLDRQKRLRIESQLIHCFISSLPMLRWMGIGLSGKKDEQITSIGNAVLDLKGYEIDIKLSESTIDQAKLMAQAISLDGKFDIKVSTFGTSSGILIHAEKSGAKSLNRKCKD